MWFLGKRPGKLLVLLVRHEPLEGKTLIKLFPYNAQSVLQVRRKKNVFKIFFLINRDSNFLFKAMISSGVSLEGPKMIQL